MQPFAGRFMDWLNVWSVLREHYAEDSLVDA